MRATIPLGLRRSRGGQLVEDLPGGPRPEVDVEVVEGVSDASVVLWVEAGEDRALAVRVALGDPASDARLSRTPQVRRIADDHHDLLVRLDLVRQSAVAGDRLVHEAQLIHASASVLVCPGVMASTRVRTALKYSVSPVAWRHAASCASKCLKRYASAYWMRASSLAASQRMRFWRAASISSRRLRSAASPRRVTSCAIGLREWPGASDHSLARCGWPPLTTKRRRSDGM